MKTIKNFKKVVIILIICCITQTMFSQKKESITVLNIETKGIIMDNSTMCNLVRMELEKTNKYEVLDKYDVNDIIEKEGINVNECFGKTCLIKVGKSLKSDNMLTGSVERIGEKIIIILKILNIKSESIVQSGVIEYLNQQPEIQHMVRISLNELLGIENDPEIVNMLVNYDRPISSPKTKIKLNGTRMGMTWITGENGDRLMAGRRDGGYNMFPVTSMFGYQHEVQYLSAGNFQALFEFLGTVNGLESGNVIPAITIMNGFRFNKGGYEFGIGPSIRCIKTASGFYYTDPDGKKEWYLEHMYRPEMGDVDIVDQIDNRGDFSFSTSLVIAVGKTIKSGYLNIPVNLYMQPRKDGATIGFSIGFNLAKKPKI